MHVGEVVFPYKVIACNAMSKEVTLFPVFYSSWDKTAASALLYQKSMASTKWCMASELAFFRPAEVHFLGVVPIQLLLLQSPKYVFCPYNLHKLLKTKERDLRNTQLRVCTDILKDA